jgi:uncharacterized protein YkwD
MSTRRTPHARARLALVVGAAAMVLLALPVRPAAAATADEQSIASELVGFVNRERATRGLPTLAVESYAAGVAQEWAERMRSSGTLSHRSDFASKYGAFPAAGQNVGTTTSGSGSAHRDLMASAEHRRNILQPGFDALGVGVACASDGRLWVTVDFVARSQAVANRYSSTIPSSSPVAVGDAGRRCPQPTTAASTVGVPGTGGYWLTARDGGIFAFGDVKYLGSTGGIPLYQPIVGMASMPNRDGYWLVARDGGVFNFGTAKFAGSMGGKPLAQPMVGMSGRPQGDGYWLTARDGGVFNFGGAKFHGSTGAVRLNQPIVGMASSGSGGGYWLVAADGGIFNFGDAKFHGSTGAVRLNQPIVGMARTPTGNGYWLVARDGGIFNFGDAKFYGSTGAVRLNQPIVGIAPTPSGKGYWLIAADGGIFNFGDAGFRGSTGALRLYQPVVGGAA